MIEAKRKNAFLRRAAFFASMRTSAVASTPLGLSLGYVEVNDKQTAIITHRPELFFPIQIGAAIAALAVLYSLEVWASHREKLGDKPNAQLARAASTGMFYALNIASAFDAVNDVSTVAFGTSFV